MPYKLFSYFIVICIVLLAGFYGPLILANQNFFYSDHGYYFEPLAKFIGNSIGQLRFPLWNPLVHCGMSQIAVPSPGVFYPPNWLFACLSYGQAFGWLMIFHQVIAGLSAFLLILSLGWGGPAACCAGIIAAFCGYMFSLVANYTLMATATWVPLNFWILHALGRAQERNKIYLLVCLGSLTFFLLIAAGRPELSVPAALSLTLFILVRSHLNRISNQANGVRTSLNVGWQCLSLLIGLLLSMPVILPAVEWLRNSPRANGLTIDTVFLWSANWYDLVSMIFAQPFGDLTCLGSPFLNLAASWSGHVPFVPSTLVGPVVLTLALWGFSDKTWRERMWFSLILLLSFLVILGKNAHIFPRLLVHLPCINLFRYPIKLIIIPIFLLALAAARGLYYLAGFSQNNHLNHERRTQAMRPHTLGSDGAPPLGVILSKNVFLYSTILWLLAFAVGYCFFAAGLLAKPLPIHPLNKSAEAQSLLGQSMLLGSVIGLATCGIAFLFRSKRIGLKVMVISINSLLILSLYLPAICYRSELVANNFYTERPFILQQIEKLGTDNTKLQKQRILLLYREPLKLPRGYLWKDSSYTVKYHFYCRQMLIPNTNMDWSQPETLGYEAAETGDYRQLAADVLDYVSSEEDESAPNSWDYLCLWKFCRATATNWLCAQTFNDQGPIPVLADTEHFQLVGEYANMNLRIYRVKEPLPRAFVCEKWSLVSSHQEALDSLAGTNDAESNFDPENAAIIERLASEVSAYSILLPAGYSTDQSGAPSKISLGKHLMPPNAVLTQAGVIYAGAKIPQSMPHSQAPIFLKDDPEHISISVNLEKANFLILADQFYPGWMAKVDGLDTPIFRANACFRAVYVPKGGHLIQFDYEPLSLTIGLYCALAGSCIAGWLLLFVFSPYAWRSLKRMAGEDV